MATISAYDSSSIGVLFSGLNNTKNNSFASTDFLGINYSDYATIQNGSYHKLLRAYYSENVSDEVKSAVSNKTSTSSDDTKTLAKIQSAAGDLKDSISNLQTAKEYDGDAYYETVKKYVNDYNTMLEQAADSNTNSILRAAKNMTNYSKVNEKLLAKVGITIGTDNKLSVDKETLQKASETDLKSLFQSRGSYAYQIQTQASLIEGYAKNEAAKANTYSSSGVYTYNYTTGELYNSAI